MSGPDDIVRAEWPEGVPPVQGSLEALVVAQDFIAFVLNLFEAINAETISPRSFAEDTTFQGAVGSVRVRTRYSQPTLKGYAWNLLFSAIAITSQAADRALCDALGKRPLDRPNTLPVDDLADFEAAWTLVYMIRCAFAHDPFNPRWECKGRYVGTLRVAVLGLTVDLGSRNGERLQSAEIGNLGGYLSLLRLLHDLLKTRLPQTRE